MPETTSSRSASTPACIKPRASRYAPSLRISGPYRGAKCGNSSNTPTRSSSLMLSKHRPIVARRPNKSREVFDDSEGTQLEARRQFVERRAMPRPSDLDQRRVLSDLQSHTE